MMKFFIWIAGAGILIVGAGMGVLEMIGPSKGTSTSSLQLMLMGIGLMLLAWGAPPYKAKVQ